MGALVPVEQLLESAIASVVAGVGVTLAFSVAIWGVARFAEHSRAERPLAAGAAATAAALGFACVAVAVAVGIVLMASR